MIAKAENPAPEPSPDGGFRGKVLAAVAEPRHQVLCINALAARVAEGSFTADEAREVRAIVLEQVRTSVNKRTKRAWAALYAVLERSDLKAVADLLGAAKSERGDQHNHLHLHGNADPRTMTRDERRAELAELDRRIAELEGKARAPSA